MKRLIQIAALLSAALVAQAQTVRVSVDKFGNQSDLASGRASLTADGRFMAFASEATNLALPDDPDTNGLPDIYVKDLITGAVVRASVSSAGVESDSYSLYPSIAAGGRYVTFYSHASNLVPVDVNGAGDVFVRDLALGLTELVSVDSSGNQGNLASRGEAISADGRFVAFLSGANNLVPGDTNSVTDIFLRDRQLGTTSIVSSGWNGAPGDGFSSGPAISDDGRSVAFVSLSTNLVPGDTNGKKDVFVRDLVSGITERVSVSSGGIEGDSNSGFIHMTGYHYASLSPDGRFVVFSSYATNLVAGDTNAVADAFLRDRQSATTVRVSLDSNGGEISDHSNYPVVFGNGRYVAFSSAAPELVANDVNGVDDVFLRDLQSGSTTLLSTDSMGVRGNLESLYPIISADGTTLVYESLATNLVQQDTNQCLDLFVCGLSATPAPQVYCSAQSNSLGCVPAIGWSGSPSLSSTAAFLITASGIVNQKPGLLLTGFSAANTPFMGGTLCIGSPITRAGGVSSGGTPAPARDCSGQFEFDVNARIQAGSSPGLVLGVEVFTQFWSRDPFAPSHVNLTDAVRCTIGF